MSKYYITKSYTELQQKFLCRFTEENSTYTLKEALQELDSYVKAYNQEKRRFNYALKHKSFTHPKSEREEYLNSVFIPKNPENQPVNKDMKVQRWQFIAMEGAIMEWLDISNASISVRTKTIERITRYKVKIELL